MGEMAVWSKVDEARGMVKCQVNRSGMEEIKDVWLGDSLEIKN